MIAFLKKLLRPNPQVDFKALLQNGAQLIDVRTPAEFAGGHIKGAMNIPLQDLPRHLSKVKPNRPIIVCCASGMRSGAAKRLLVAQGYPEVHNGGGWTSLQNRLQ
ncbi:MAG: rhodanese-like domain-containing protein [Bernardetiaceae bacterium]|nr:rhodanese-like domain-containing protein [Bernardetiaceae bacterium]